MNLVIDDAVEVVLANKDVPEQRRKVGELKGHYANLRALTICRPNPPQGRQHLSYPANPVIKIPPLTCQLAI